MADGTAYVTNRFKADVLKGLVNATATTGHQFKIVICSSGQTIDGTCKVADWTQITATNYVVKSLLKASQSVTQQDTPNNAMWDCSDDITWTALGTPSPTAASIGLYDDDHADDIVCEYWDLVTQPNGGDFTIQFNSSGIMLLA